MATVMEVQAPSPEDMGNALLNLARLMQTAADVANPTEGPLQDILSLYGAFIDSVQHRFADAAEDMLGEYPPGQGYEYAYRIVYEEINYIVNENSEIGATEISSSTLSRVADDVEIVKGSIESVFERLPKWVRNLLDVGLEILRLTSGRID
jgi:hypothetical protein